MKIIFLFVLFLLVKSAYAQNGPSYPLYCKGGFTYRIQPPFIFIVFTHSNVNASDNGAHLKPGTCAFVDRPLNEAEPKLISLPSIGEFSYYVGMTHNMYQSCSINKKCVISARVRNTGSNTFEIDPSQPDVRSTEP